MEEEEEEKEDGEEEAKAEEEEEEEEKVSYSLFWGQSVRCWSAQSLDPSEESAHT